jgi:predicted NAD/FAD-binding protein
VTNVRRIGTSVVVTDLRGNAQTYDHVVLASHADQSLAMLDDADGREQALLGSFLYSRNLAVLHSDTSFMPKNRRVWSSWNFVGRRGAPQEGVAITYWMNKLQNLGVKTPVFVTLNPTRAPRHGTLLQSEVYHHPIFNTKTALAQKDLWSLQGRRNTWFCGAYFGAGFHEDGLQAGLAVAEQLGGVRRPWNVEQESERIALSVPRCEVVA